MLSEITRILIQNDISIRTKLEIINKFYCNKPEKLAFCIQLGGIKDVLKIRMFNILIKKLIKHDNSEALAISFLILSHDQYTNRMKKITNKFLKIYNSVEIEKHEVNDKLLSDILTEFEV